MVLPLTWIPILAKESRTFSDSRFLMKPLSMWMAMIWSSFNACLINAAHTVESTPPDSNILKYENIFRVKILTQNWFISWYYFYTWRIMIVSDYQHFLVTNALFYVFNALCLAVLNGKITRKPTNSMQEIFHYKFSICCKINL